MTVAKIKQHGQREREKAKEDGVTKFDVVLCHMLVTRPRCSKSRLCADQTGSTLGYGLLGVHAHYGVVHTRLHSHQEHSGLPCSTATITKEASGTSGLTTMNKVTTNLSNLYM